MSTLTSLAKKAVATSKTVSAGVPQQKATGTFTRKPAAAAAAPPPVGGQKRGAPEAGAAKKKVVAGAAVQTEVPTDDWSGVQMEEIAVVPRMDGKKVGKGLTVIRRGRGKDGKLLPLELDKRGLFAYRTPIMKVAYSSDLNGEGNLGKGDPPATRMKAKYYLRLLAGHLDGEEIPERHAEQVAFVEKTYAISRHIMGLVFDAKDKEWDHHIGEAMAATRKELMRDHGFTKPKQLEDKEAQDPKLKAEVLAKARTYFIDHASSLPGGQRDDDEGYASLQTDEGMSVILKKKVWPLVKYDPAKDALSNETGVPASVASNIQNWPRIKKEMESKYRTHYCAINYCEGRSGKTIERLPLIEFPDGSTPEPDPFFNPCLVDRNGVPQESLVVVSGTWGIYHTGATKGKHYGVRLDLNPQIAIVKRKARRVRTIVVVADDAEEFVDEVIEPATKKARAQPPAEEAEVEDAPGEDAVDAAADNAVDEDVDEPAAVGEDAQEEGQVDAEEEDADDDGGVDVDAE